MGQAKIRQYNRQQFLREHPACAYCGDPATTTDHCPPRAFFVQRYWPETYEFPACAKCNADARRDEQVLAVLVRVQMNEEIAEPARTEWRRMIKGLANNHPEYLSEWQAGGARIKRALREMFGPVGGDQRRRAGWGALHIGGPLTRAATDQFGIKLGKALFYRHVQSVFEGDIYVRHIDPLHIRRNPQHFRNVLELAPQLSDSQRSGRNLADQFVYRYAYSEELGAVNAVIRIGPQFIFHILAIREDTVQAMEAAGEPPISTGGVFHCKLHSAPVAGCPVR